MGLDVTAVGDAVGKSSPRLEGREKVMGRATYTDDMSVPGMLYGAVLGSPYPHARILSIDTTEAAGLAGVRAVITAADIPDERIGSAIKDEPILARGKVRCIGEPVAAVAAIDLATARLATRLIAVEYEEIEAVFDLDEAMQDGAPVIHEERASYESMFDAPEGHPNILSYSRYQEGEPEDAWAQCDVIVEDVYTTAAQEHMYLEPCSTLVDIDTDGRVIMWSSTQSVFRTQQMTAAALGLPMSKVRVIAPRIGGGFGGKVGLTNQPLNAALALAARAAVKMTMSREDDMMTVKNRHSSKVYMRTGARSDGTLVARDARIYLDTGAYSDEGPEVGSVAANFARGPYRIPHVNAQAWTVYTNRVKSGAFRGFGNPQVTFAGEQQIDMLATELGLDPLDLRTKNGLQAGDTWLGGQTVETSAFTECMDAARTASNWQERRQKNETSAGKRRGIGAAAVGHLSAMLSAGARVSLNEDGTITVNTGAVDIGEGADTVMAQIAAGALGLTLDQVRYGNPDTDHSPYNFQTSASRVTFTVGQAVAQAAGQVKQQIFHQVAEMLECAEEDLELRPGGVAGIKGVADAQLPFAAAAGRSLFATDGPIVGDYNWRFPSESFDPKRTLLKGLTLDGAGVFTFGVQIVEVEVDEATGHVELLQAWCAHDVGRALNPASVEGQIHGGFVQGLGYALSEQLIWEDGRLANPSMMDYKVPGAADVPHHINPIIIEKPALSGPFGAKAIWRTLACAGRRCNL